MPPKPAAKAAGTKGLASGGGKGRPAAKKKEVPPGEDADSDDAGEDPEEVEAARIAALEQCKARGLFQKRIDEKVNQETKHTPLMIQAIGGHIEKLTLLMVAGADIMLLDQNNDTALHMAAMCHSLECCEALLKKGGEELLKKQNMSGYTCLHSCVEAKPRDSEDGLCKAEDKPIGDIIDLFLKVGGDDFFDIQNKFGDTCLHTACQKASRAVVRHLLGHGGAPAVGPKNFVDSTCIHYAVARGDPELAELVITACGTDILRVKKNGGLTAMHACAAGGNSAIFDALVSQGGRDLAKEVTLRGDTPLHIATQHGHADLCASILRTIGPEALTAKNKKGDTSVHIAAARGLVPLLEAFGESAAKGSLRVGEAANADGFAPLHLAAQEGHTEACAVLQGKGGGSNTALYETLSNAKDTVLHMACYGPGDPSLAAGMVESQGVEFAMRKNRDGYTCLHYAALMNRTGTAAAVADLCGPGLLAAQNSYGDTCLHVAAAKGHLDLVRVLCEKGGGAAAAGGSLVGVRNNKGESALDVARTAPDKGKTAAFLEEQMGGLSV